MDVETSAALEQLGGRIDALQGEVRAPGTVLRSEMLAGDSRLRLELRAEIRDGLAENRRHSEVQFESLRDDIRLIAEGLAVVSAKIDTLRP